VWVLEEKEGIRKAKPKKPTTKDSRSCLEVKEKANLAKRSQKYGFSRLKSGAWGRKVGGTYKKQQSGEKGEMKENK